MTRLPLGRECDECFMPFIKGIGRRCEPTHKYEGNTVKLLLKLLFGSIFVFVLVRTVGTCLLVSLWSASLGAKILWFVLIMAGGNITMYLYVLLQLFGLRPDQPASALFGQKAA
jgi:hypothetical protein